jgi:hypothetical protein
MSLELTTITFNHDPSSTSNSAMNVRRNKDFEIPIPEHDRANPRTPRESSAAYAIAETAETTVFIRVTFRIPSPSNPTYEVQATGGDVLGQLDPIQVMFTELATSQTVDRIGFTLFSLSPNRHGRRLLEIRETLGQICLTSVARWQLKVRMP